MIPRYSPDFTASSPVSQVDKDLLAAVYDNNVAEAKRLLATPGVNPVERYGQLPLHADIYSPMYAAMQHAIGASFADFVNFPPPHIPRTEMLAALLADGRADPIGTQNECYVETALKAALTATTTDDDYVNDDDITFEALKVMLTDPRVVAYFRQHQDAVFNSCANCASYRSNKLQLVKAIVERALAQ